MKMNEIVNKFLLTGDKSIPEVYVDHFLKTKKEFKNSNKQEIQATYTNMNLMRLAFNTIWLMENLKI